MVTRAIKHFLGMALPVLAVFALPAFAETVDFTTVGTFSCGTIVTGCSISNGGKTITVTNGTPANTVTETAIGETITNLVVGSPDAFLAQLIEFDGTSTNNSNSGGATGVNFTGATFTLTINQTAPTVASASFTGKLTGKIFVTGTNAFINFCFTSQHTCANQDSTVILGDVKYALDTPSDWGFQNASSRKGQFGITFQTGDITPEPKLIWVTGLLFGVVGFLALRRRATV